MKILKNITLLLITCLTVVSCQKVIDVDLNAASPKYVIEATVSNTAVAGTVKITQTKNFNDDNNFAGITNANVILSDNAGNTETLSMVKNGLYQTSVLTGVPGRTYFLTVKIDNAEFTSSSTMPYPVQLDTLTIFNFVGFGDTLKIVDAEYQDPPGVTNYYKHNLYVNNKRAKSVDISNDELDDGNLVTRSLFYQDGNKELKSGDSVKVEMLCIDKPMYDYFFSLEQTITQSAATPANPVTNIAGGALGYFSAYTTTTKRIKAD